MNNEEPSVRQQAWAQIKAFLELLDTSLFKMGGQEISLLFIGYILLAIMVLFFVAGRIKRLLVRRILPRYKTNQGIAESIGTITRYAILVIGMVVIFSSAGIDLSALSVLAGALGIGIGFGLQNITNNFISGIIILLENPIKVGDRIQVGDIYGNVTDIRARSTIINTNDNIDIIVPNSEFIDKEVINWSLNDRKVRIYLPFGVSYSEKPEKIRQLVEEVAAETEGILDTPKPQVWFHGFGDSSLDFQLVFWTDTYTETPPVIKSILYYAIFAKFEEHGIEIPFPQRDIHIRSDQTKQPEAGS